jgi:hypothetical protein
MLVAFVARLRVYDFWRGEGVFAELLRILDKDCVTAGLSHQNGERILRSRV